MGAAIWAFLNSPLGMTLIASAVAKIFHYFIKDDARAKQVFSYCDTAFAMVELLAASNPALRGVQKYNRFVEQIVNSLRAAGAPELSAKEMEAVKAYARQKSILDKR